MEFGQPQEKKVIQTGIMGQRVVDEEVRRLYNEIKGKLCFLFGNPMVGKTTLAHLVSNLFKHCIVYKIDKNYTAETFRAIANPNIRYVEIDRAYQLRDQITHFPSYYKEAYNERQDCLLIVDSMTSIQSEFFSDPMKASPRDANIMNNFCDFILRRLSKYKPATSLVICHEKIADFKTGEIIARVNRILYRHVDAAFRIVEERDSEGNVVARKIVKTSERKIKTENFNFTW